MAEKESVVRKATCQDCFHYNVCSYHITEETTMTVNECSHKFVNKNDVAKVRHGEWVRKGWQALPGGNSDGKYETVIECSLCGRQIAIRHDEPYGVEDFVNGRYPYCHCGAKMDGATDTNVGGKMDGKGEGE